MSNQRLTVKEIRRESKGLEDISDGDIVSIIGIVNKQQNDRGRVIYADGTGTEGKFILVAVRNVQDRLRISVESYFDICGIMKKTSVEYSGCVEFERYDKLLSEVGL